MRVNLWAWAILNFDQEFLLFLLPLVNTRALRRQLSAATSHISLETLLPAPLRVLAKSSQSQEAGKLVPRGKYWTLSPQQCAICAENASTNLNFSDPANALTSLTAASPYAAANTANEDDLDDPDYVPQFPIHNPYITSCGHVYCYYCITERMMRTADERSGIGLKGTRWECLRCTEGVVAVDRVEAEAEGPEYESGVDDGSDDDDSALSFDYGSEDVEFTDMSGSIGGSYVDSESDRASG